MDEDYYANLPDTPGYLTIKRAAKVLGLATPTLYEYIREGKIRATRADHIILIPEEEVRKFKRGTAGKKRTVQPIWRISPENNEVFTTLMVVSIRPGQQTAFLQRLESIRQAQQHLFLGTVERHIVLSETHPERVEIMLIWRSTVMPAEDARAEALEAFKQELADVLDWDTAQVSNGKDILHT